MSWRYQGGPGSGRWRTSDGTWSTCRVLCGPVRSVRWRGAATVVGDRPVPLGMAIGHAAGVPVSDVARSA